MERTTNYPDTKGKPVVQLRIALRLYDVIDMSIDPMHEENLDDEDLFPSVKPNTDVFGLQRYNSRRKQRGWYQVRCWPFVLVKTVSKRADYATGADVPPELFDGILSKYFELADCLHKDWRSIIRLTTKDLRLVCRRWAHYCLLRAFRYLTIRNIQDINDILAFLDAHSTLSEVAIRSIRLQLDLAVKYSYRPWIDVFYRRILPHFPKRLLNCKSELHISGPLPSGRTLRSIYSTSPCRFPWHCLPITQLRLTNLHLKTFNNLSRVLRELPMLTWVEGSDITWDIPMDDPSSFPRMTAFVPCPNIPSKIQYRFDKSCFETAPWLAITLSHSPATRLQQRDAHKLWKLLSNVFRDRHSYQRHAWWAEVDNDAAILNIGVSLSRKSWSECGLSPSMQRFIRIKVQLITTESCKSPTVRSMCFDSNDSGSTIRYRMDASSWSSLDKQAADLDIQFLRLDMGGLDTAIQFHTEIVRLHMQHLEMSKRIQYRTYASGKMRSLLIHGRDDVYEATDAETGSLISLPPECQQITFSCARSRESTVCLGIPNCWIEKDSSFDWFFDYRLWKTVEPAEDLFPSIKPNADVFGPPRYVRRHGWYQIKRCGHERNPHNSGRGHYATGMDILSIPIDSILKYCNGNRNAILLRLRLVSRQWADACHTKRFVRIRLRNLQDMTGFLDLLDRSSSLHEIVDSIDLQLDTTSTRSYQPWIVDFCCKVLPRLPKLRSSDIKLHITGPLPVGRTLASIHSTSPCRFPWLMLKIEALYLCDLHLNKFRDLFRVLKELRILRRVDGERITWDTSTDGIESYPLVTSIPWDDDLPMSINYTFKDSVGSRSETSALLAIYLARSPYCLQQTDADTLYGIVSSILIDGVYRAWAHRSDVILNWTSSASSWYGSSFSLCAESHQSTSTIVSLDVYFKRSTDSRRYSVERIDVWFYHKDLEQNVSAIPWPTVDKLAADLGIQSMSIHFQSIDDVASFHTKVAGPSMPRLSRQKLLEYKFEHNLQFKLARIREDGTIEVDDNMF